MKNKTQLDGIDVYKRQILQNSELFKLFFSKGFGNGGGHLAFIMQNIFLVEL